MKNSLPIMFFLVLAIMVSCGKENNGDTNKPNTDPPLEGDWKMTLYIDSTLGVTETKADSYLHPNVYSGTLPYPPVGDVTMKITFTDPAKTTGTIAGTAIANGCSMAITVTPQRDLHRVSFMRTLAIDPPWGEYFFSYIFTTNTYSFVGDSILRMQSPTKTLVFERVP